jgi:DNA-binding XRE family transcriptional regulator
MLAVVKTPHTRHTAFSVLGHIDRKTLMYLNDRFGRENIDIDNEKIDVIESDWFKNLSKTIAAGTVVRIYRENLDMSQQQLADKAGIATASYISDIENGRRPVFMKIPSRGCGAYYCIDPNQFKNDKMLKGPSKFSGPFRTMESLREPPLLCLFLCCFSFACSK